MPIPTDTDYGYAIALRKAARVPSSILAVPDASGPSYDHARSTGLRAAQEATASMTRDEAEAKRSESARQASLNSESKSANLALYRQQLDEWASQNAWATAIGGANLLFQGLGAAGQSARHEARQQRTQALQEEQIALARTAREQLRKMAADQTAFLADLAQRRQPVPKAWVFGDYDDSYQ